MEIQALTFSVKDHTGRSDPHSYLARHLKVIQRDLCYARSQLRRRNEASCSAMYSWVITVPLWVWQAADQIKRLYDLFLKVDATQVEVNPLGETPEGQGNT